MADSTTSSDSPHQEQFMKTRIVVAGFRHGHIFDIYHQAQKRPDTELVGTAEEDAATREQLQAKGIAISHDSIERLLDEVPCDVVAIGDYYSRRGPIAIAALQRGKHVIADKPICITLAEHREIARLAAERQRCVGCQLDLRHSGKFRALRRLIRDEALAGEIHAISFGGQHPLNLASRPGWYFEPGKHGGTIVDIAIHGLDIIPWLTGLRFAHLDAARNWNAGPKHLPHFRDAAQLMLTLDNGAGVLGDVSYLIPDSHGYACPLYWRVTLWGTKAVLEVDSGHAGVMIYANGEKTGREVPPDAPGAGTLEALLHEIRGAAHLADPTTAEVLDSTFVTLRVQEAADQRLTNLPL
jgi:predicted dehydrogenase